MAEGRAGAEKLLFNCPAPLRDKLRRLARDLVRAEGGHFSEGRMLRELIARAPEPEPGEDAPPPPKGRSKRDR